MEDKTRIVAELLPVLQLTRMFSDLKALEYGASNAGEYVTATFDNGFQKRVNVSGDSGVAVIRDIIGQLS